MTHYQWVNVFRGPFLMTNFFYQHNHLYLPTNITSYCFIHIILSRYNIVSGSRRAETRCKVLMMMKAAKLGWAGAGAGIKQGWTKSRAEVGTGQE